MLPSNALLHSQNPSMNKREKRRFGVVHLPDRHLGIFFSNADSLEHVSEVNYKSFWTGH